MTVSIFFLSYSLFHYNRKGILTLLLQLESMQRIFAFAGRCRKRYNILDEIP